MSYEALLQRKYRDLIDRSFDVKLKHFQIQSVYDNGEIGKIDQLKFIQFDFEPYLKRLEKLWSWELKVEFRKGITVDHLFQLIYNWNSENDIQKKELKKRYVDSFSDITIKELEEVYPEKEKRQCFYCKKFELELIDMHSNELMRTKTGRGWELEIDRKNPNGKYVKDNLVLSCYWCNNAKTDEFGAEEFIPIGKAIRKVWDERKKHGIVDSK